MMDTKMKEKLDEMSKEERDEEVRELFYSYVNQKETKNGSLNCEYFKGEKENQWVKVKFHGFFQKSEIVPPSPLKGGHCGGVIQYPVALVEDEYGVHEVLAHNVRRIE